MNQNSGLSVHESDKLARKIISDPEALFAVLLGNPFPYQRRVLNSLAREIAFRAARQVGKTTVIAGKALHHALNPDFYFDKPVDPLVLCIAPSSRQANHIFGKIRQAVRENFLKHRVIRETSQEIEILNSQGKTSRIIVLPGGNPTTITGFSPTLLIIDEAADLKEDTFIEILPSLRFTKGYLIMISTPHGKSGRFYQAFTDDSFEKYHVRAIECPVNTPEELEKEKNRLTDLEYQRMIEGEFVESMDTYFSRELVLSCVAEVEQHTQAKDHREYYLGVDVARYGLDETVYTIAEVDNQQNVNIIFVKSTSKKPLTDVVGRVTELSRVLPFRAVYIDESGLGGGAVDMLVSKGVPVKNLNNETGGVQFTLQNKEQMYKNLKLLMERQKLKYPNHQKLVQQISDLQYKFTEAGHLQLHHPDRGHDDFPDSLALACAGIQLGTYKPYIAI